MSKKILKMPQEIEVWYVLPTIRKAFTLEMVKKGLSQRKAASLLGITEAAVSQYIKRKRASEIGFNKKIRDETKKSVDKIIKGGDVITEMQRICLLIKRDKTLCKIHRCFCKVPIKCEVCLDGGD